MRKKIKNNKFKATSSSKKRFFALNGKKGEIKIKRSHSFTSHLSHSKTTKQVMHLRKSAIVKKCEFKRIKLMLLNNG